MSIVGGVLGFARMRAVRSEGVQEPEWQSVGKKMCFVGIGMPETRWRKRRRESGDEGFIVSG